MNPHKQPDADSAAQAAKTLIDGYNLMYAAGIVGRRRGRGGLEHSRAALLDLLAESLPPDEAPRTVVVFDAQRPPPGFPHTMRHRGLIVYFASDHDDADALLEELIARHSAPRQLTVVSSDHRLHRAARRRRARAVDSDVWHEELLRGRNELRRAARRAGEPVAEPSEDVEFWLREFEAAVPALPPPAEHDPQPPRPAKKECPPPIKRSKSRGAKRSPSPRSKKKQLPEGFVSFPPGYGDDLINEEGEPGA